MWWKKNKWKVIAPIAIVALLAFAFWYGGDAPGLQGWTVGGEDTAGTVSPSPTPQGGTVGTGDTASPTPSSPSPSPAPTETGGGAQTQDPAEDPAGLESPPPSEEPAALPSPPPTEDPAESESPPPSEEPAASPSPPPAEETGSGESSPGVEEGDAGYSESAGMELDPETGTDQYLTGPVPEGRPVPVEPEDAAITDTAYTCTISISCAEILNHMDWLNPDKVELVPGDGWILEPMEVTFYEGESVFNVLQRTCKQELIHLEFVNTPMYNSAYIEGLHNLYEFDCGSLSGWMYSVNDWYPNYGSSRYQLADGDVIRWVFTCDLGKDVGGHYAYGTQN